MRAAISRILIITLLLGAGISGATPLTAEDIDPFIGTGGHGHTFPGPTLPFGMVQLSPDTRLEGWDGCSIYHDSDRVVYGFSHTHLSGTGVGDYGDILLMPVTGVPRLENGYPDQVGGGYGSRFRKDKEAAAAGYYRTHLDDYGIEVELTTTARTGLHRYRFPAGTTGSVILDLRHRDRLLDVGLTVVDSVTVEGFRRSEAWARDQLVHFRAVFSKPFNARLENGVGEMAGKPVLAVLDFGAQGGELIAQVAISAVDAEGARRNLEAEWEDFGFDRACSRARHAWDQALAPFALQGATASERAIMATALYHSFIAPNLFSDADGRYRGLDRKVHRAEDRAQYTVFSLWDTYRATHPLFTLVQRERTRDFVLTALSHRREGGQLPVWELAGNETDCMIGYHSVSFIADAYLKGIGGFDPEEALAAMVETARFDQPGLGHYINDGFISTSGDAESVSKTLEYAYDDACIARMARAMGQEATAQEFGRRAQSWRHLFDPSSRCFRPRDGGLWLKPYDPRQVDIHHTEANGWQYRFGAPHHMRQHIELLGGDEACTAILDSLFTMDSATVGRDQPDITGRMGQYAHGNEPSHHIAWLYHFTGLPQKSADRVGRILREFYTDRPDGLIGNEDCGQMSSWYVLAAYGLYDVAPTSGQWLIIPPRHESMSMEFKDGRVFTTRREGQGAVRRVTFNGRPLARGWLSHEEVIGGGELVFELGEGGDWGQDFATRPGTEPVSAPIVPAPWAEAEDFRFRGHTEVTLACADPQARLFWKEIGEGEFRPYTGAIERDRSFGLLIQARREKTRSPRVPVQFRALPVGWRVTLVTRPNPQYAAGGGDVLIDARRPRDDWRTGGYLGFEQDDFVAILDLGQPTDARRVGVRCLQDTRSWILMPPEVVVEVSSDGKTFREAGRVATDVDPARGRDHPAGDDGGSGRGAGAGVAFHGAQYRHHAGLAPGSRGQGLRLRG